MSDIEPIGSDPLSAGQEALQRAVWEEARACFEGALAGEETAQAYEGLSWACWWQDDFEPLVQAREAAFRLYRQQNDSLGAARMAIWLAADYCDFRGEAAISNGWLRRAERRTLGRKEPWTSIIAETRSETRRGLA